MKLHEEERILAIDPTTKGFGYIVFEGPRRPIDWGTASVKGPKHAGCLKRVEKLVARYKPAVIVLEDPCGEASRRCVRVRRLLSAIEKAAAKRKIKVRRYARGKVREAFSEDGAFTKDEIATAIAGRHKELSPRLPPPRKCWMTEAEGMSVFDAAGFARAYFVRRGRAHRSVP